MCIRNTSESVLRFPDPEVGSYADNVTALAIAARCIKSEPHRAVRILGGLRAHLFQIADLKSARLWCRVEFLYRQAERLGRDFSDMEDTLGYTHISDGGVDEKRVHHPSNIYSERR